MEDRNTEEEEQFSSKEEKKEEGVKKYSILKEFLVYALIIVLCVIVVPRYVIQRTEVDGGSMMNTLLSHENLLVEKCVWRVSGLERFDIITFYPYGRKGKSADRDGDGKADYYIKRVIGLPGEKVQVVGDTIYINDKALDDSKYKASYNLDEGPGDEGIAEEPIRLKDDEYFVMGDHRGVSADSRTEEIGPVKREKIDGRVVLRIYPFSKFGTVD